MMQSWEGWFYCCCFFHWDETLCVKKRIEHDKQTYEFIYAAAIKHFLFAIIVFILKNGSTQPSFETGTTKETGKIL